MNDTTPLPKLPPHLEIINDALEVLSRCKDEHSFFLHLCVHVMPLLQAIPTIGSIRKEWSDARNQHLKQTKIIEKRAQKQVWKFYKYLTQTLNTTIIQSIDGLEALLKEIDDLQNNLIPYYTPTEYEIAFDSLSKVCSLLVEHGHGHLIKKYVDTVTSTTYVKTNDGVDVLTDVHYVIKTNFAPAFFSLWELKKIWFWKSTEPWVLWQHLCNAMWAWSSPANTFAKEKMRKKTALLRMRTMRTMHHQQILSEMHAIKDSNNEKNRFYFTIDRFKKWLSIVLLEINKHFGPCLNNDLSILFYRIELHLFEIKTSDSLWISLCQNENSTAEYYCLRKFKEGSETFQFAKQLIDNTTQRQLHVTSRTPADLIARCNLNAGGLRSLFFGEASSNAIQYLGCMREGIHIDKCQLKELTTHLYESHQKANNPTPPKSSYHR